MTPRLTKRDVEHLLSSYDDDPTGALCVALRRLTGRTDDTFDQLIEQLVAAGSIDVSRRSALLSHDVRALDALAAELNENRNLRS